MLKKVNLTDVHFAIMQKIKEHTKLEVYDVVPEDTKAPFVALQCMSKQDDSTKTMYVEVFNFYIHIFADGKSSVGLYDLIEKVEESLTEDIAIEGLLSQMEEGILQIIDEDLTNEKRAVLSYKFKICYGYKVKI